MIPELVRVVLTEPVPAERLERGDVGTVVRAYVDGKAFEVKFMTLDGQTAAVVTVEASAVRPVTAQDIRIRGLAEFLIGRALAMPPLADARLA